MDDRLIFRLKEFYKLEKLQVSFYKAQLDSATDEYYSKVFEKLVKIEQSHVDFFEGLIERAGELVPSFSGSLFHLAGDIIGETVELTGQHKTCELGAELENKAIEHYRLFIEECKQKNYTILRDNLMEYVLDEEFHALWLRDYSNKHPNE